jgi:hypothetical protein
MPKGLWTKVNGEPFMENTPPRLGILNKRKRGAMAARKKKSGSKKGFVKQEIKSSVVRSFKKNPWPVGGAIVNKKKKPRFVKTKAAIKKYKQKRPERTVNILGISLPPLETVLYTGVGVVVSPITESFIARFLPLELTTSLVGRYAVRIASVLGLAWAAKVILGPNEAKAVGVGGGTYVLVSAIKDFAPGVIPGLSSYPRMASYPRGLNGYQASTGAAYRPLGFQRLGQPRSWGSPLNVSGHGSATAQTRFNRFGR